MGKLRKFRYEAFDKNGNQIEGVEPAVSSEEVIFKLLQKGLYPSRVETLTNLNGFAFERLEKFRELRDKLSPPEHFETPPPIARPRSLDRYIITGIVLLWAAILAAYLLCS